MKQNNDSYEITWLVRRLFRAMAQDANERLAGRGLTAADRAIMEFLYPDEELTVPEIATRYQVSRQHIQTTVNGLLKKKIVKTKSNPNHKRSSLLALTAQGRKLFSSIRDEDQKTLTRVFRGISRNDLRATHKTLEAVLHRLGQGGSS